MWGAWPPDGSSARAPGAVTPFSTLYERKSSWLGPLGSLVADLVRDSGPSSPSSAMRIAAAYACVRVIAETVASLPLFVYRRVDGGKQRATDAPLYRLLHDQPTGRHTSFAWREMLQAHLCLRGNAYARIYRSSDGTPQELWPLHPDRVEVVEQSDLSVVYRVQLRNGAGRIDLPASDVLHVVGLSMDGLVGRSPVQDARYAFEVADATAQTASTLYTRGFRHGVILTHPKTLGDDGAKNLRESFAAHYGPNGSEYPIVLEEDVKPSTLTMTPDDAQFLETRKFARSEIAALFRVPPHLIGDLERATFSNIEQQSIEFVTHCIRPWLVRWEQALTRALLPADSGLFVEFQLDALLRGDSESRAKFYQAMHQVGAFDTNEIRALENLNPTTGGDVRYVPGNLMRLGSVGAAGAPTTERRSEVAA